MPVLSILTRARSEARALVRTLMRRGDAEREMDEEMRFHVEMQAAQHRRAGMSPAEAERAALLAFGGSERFKEEVRDARGGRAVEDVARDLRYATRVLLRAPAFTIASIASLAVGIGAVMAVFTVAYSVLFAPLPFPRAERLVSVGHSTPGFGAERAGLSDATFLHYREHARGLADLAGYFDRVLSLTDEESPELIDAALVTPNLFAVLGAAPLIGRVFSDADGPEAPPIVVISHGLWQRRYGGDPAIVGRTIEINRQPRQVVGVMPADFHFPTPRTQLWFNFPIERPRTAELRHLYLEGIGRLRDGVTATEAQAELDRLVPTLSDRYADASPEVLAEGDVRARVVPLRHDVTRDVRPALVLVLGTTLFVLLATVVNVGNLSLVRAERRTREVAVARALGAGTRHIARRMLGEALLVSFAGGAVALAAVWLATALRFGFDADAIPRLHELRLGGAVVAATVALTLGSTIVLTALSLVATRSAGIGLLRAGRSGNAGRRSRWSSGRQLLVTLQVALSLTVLVGAAIMARSYQQLRAAELGFDPRSVLAFDLELPYRPYPTFQAAATFYAELLEGLRAIPGVTAAEASGLMPLDPKSGAQTLLVRAEGFADAESGAGAAFGYVTPGYFETMGIPIVRGRSPTAMDVHAEVPGAVISAAFARAHFGDADPVGQRITVGSRARQLRIVGVAGDVPAATIGAGAVRALYVPAANDPPVDSATAARLPYTPGAETVVIRTSVPPAMIVPAVRRALREVDAKVPMARLRTMDDVVSGALARARITAWLLGGAAATALLLAIIGIYGVVAYAVSLRTPELGLRIALGATPGAVRRLVLRQGLTVAVVGIAAGIIGALALTRLLVGLLYEVSPRDPLAFATMPLLLLAITLAATYLPARRAARLDPSEALRAE